MIQPDQVAASGRSSVAVCEGYFSTISATPVTGGVATLAPGGNYAAVSTVALPAITVGQATCRSVITASPAGGSVTGQSVTFTATLTFDEPGGLGATPSNAVAVTWNWQWTGLAPTSTVQTVTTPAVCETTFTIVGGRAVVRCTVPLQAGGWQINVAWAGDTNYIHVNPTTAFSYPVTQGNTRVVLTSAGPFLATAAAAPTITATLALISPAAVSVILPQVLHHLLVGQSAPSTFSPMECPFSLRLVVSAPVVRLCLLALARCRLPLLH
jgi:hypothetical protein